MILLSWTTFAKAKKIWSNSGGVITDLGDGIINLEFYQKWILLVVMFYKQSIAIDLAENEYQD
jgi:3-hydroxyacyl-CoA dehydrogenase